MKFNINHELNFTRNIKDYDSHPRVLPLEIQTFGPTRKIHLIPKFHLINLLRTNNNKHNI
jgi:hypothetical protein